MLFVCAALALTVGAGTAAGSASPPAKTNVCSVLDGSLAAEAPGTPAFHRLARQALQHGCVAYVTDPSSDSLGLQFVRGPLTGTSITIGPQGVVLTDLASTASGTLYGIGFSQLYTVDVDTGQATVVGSVDASVNGLVVGPDGTLYASGGFDLLTIDPTTGAGTVVGYTGFSSSGDLAFAQDGTLYMTSNGDSLVRIDPATGAGTLVGPIGSYAVYGLVSSYGTLFGTTDFGQLVTIDPSTGAGTVVTSGGSRSWGAASPPDTV